jgi:RNA-directed DNA polymerase
MNGQEKPGPAMGRWETDERNAAMRLGAGLSQGRGPRGMRASKARTGRRTGVIEALERIRQAARRNKKEKFTALMRPISVDLLETAFLELRKTAAPGIDGVTWQDYEADLEGNLADLHDRVQSGAHRATPSRRVSIPKPDGGRRPLAVAALEDKACPRARPEDCPARRGSGAERHLRGRLPRVQLRLSARARRARRARRPHRRRSTAPR